MRTFLIAAPLVLLALVSHAGATGGEDHLYVLLSKPIRAPSAIVRLDVGADGRLEQRETYDTGGEGNDSLGQQELVFDPTRRLLFATNNASGDISVFRVSDDGSLTSVPGSPFGLEAYPTQLALHPSLPVLYVSQGRRGPVGVYAIEDEGALTRVQSVATPSPRDVEVEPGGRFLYVAAMFDIPGVHGYSISEAGLLTALPGSPFTYESGRPGQIEVSSDRRWVYALDLDRGIAVFAAGAEGELALVEGSPFSVENGLARPLELSEDDRFAYVGFASHVFMRGYAFRSDGTPTELEDSPFDAAEGIAQIVVANGTSRLIQITEEMALVRTYDVEADGALVMIQEVQIEDAEQRRGQAGAFVLRMGAPCRADLNFDRRVGRGDLEIVLTTWGPCGGACRADIDDDGRVGMRDLALVLSAWGACP